MAFEKARKAYRVFQKVWVTSCIVLLVLSLIHANSPDNRDNIVVLTWLMLVSTFPSGVTAIFALTYLPDLYRSENAYVFLPITWAAFFVAGSAQWFLLIPPVVRMIDRRFGSSPIDNC